MNTYNESILSNGLRIISSENKNSEVVCFSVWIRAGSRYETKKQLGYAHILEHMLLKGTKNYPSVFKVNKVIDRLGADFNAFTGLERIYVYIEVAKKNSEKVFKLLSDIILNSLLNESVFKNEKNVIIEELRRDEDVYVKYLRKVSMKRVFKGHFLSQLPLGDEKFIKPATINEIKKYYYKFFIPQRTALIATGAVSHQKIVNLAKKYFRQWKGKQIADSLTMPKIKTGFNFKKITTKQTYISFSYTGPKITFKEAVILDIFSIFLGYGNTSLLYQELRHKQGLIYGISVSNSIFQDANLFYINTSTGSPEKVISSILDKIENLNKYFTKQIFKELKEQTINIYLRKINYGDFKFLGEGWQSFNRLITPEEYIKAIENSSYEDLMAVKNKYLKKDNLLITVLGEKNPFV